ncbi:hypothetical protein LTR28_011106 [Elasticomyces elasticus]|nr:hypothetical protein LTR28_011106 [Elasticomyces elasticus]
MQSRSGGRLEVNDGSVGLRPELLATAPSNRDGSATVPKESYQTRAWSELDPACSMSGELAPGTTSEMELDVDVPTPLSLMLGNTLPEELAAVATHGALCLTKVGFYEDLLGVFGLARYVPDSHGDSEV